MEDLKDYPLLGVVSKIKELYLSDFSNEKSILKENRMNNKAIAIVKKLGRNVRRQVDNIIFWMLFIGIVFYFSRNLTLTVIIAVASIFLILYLTTKTVD